MLGGRLFENLKTTFLCFSPACKGEKSLVGSITFLVDHPVEILCYEALYAFCRGGVLGMGGRL